jgi:hypothetical protein
VKKIFIFLSALGLLLLTGGSLQNAYATESSRINFNELLGNQSSGDLSEDIEFENQNEGDFSEDIEFENQNEEVTLSVYNDISDGRIGVIVEERDCDSVVGNDARPLENASKGLWNILFYLIYNVTKYFFCNVNY